MAYPPPPRARKQRRPREGVFPEALGHGVHDGGDPFPPGPSLPEEGGLPPRPPPPEPRRPPRPAGARSVVRSRRGSAVSSAKLVSAPMDLAASSGVTGRSSTPLASAQRCRPASPKRATSAASGQDATAPMVMRPSERRRRSVLAPTPQRRETGRGGRNPFSCPGGAGTQPAGG